MKTEFRLDVPPYGVLALIIAALSVVFFIGPKDEHNFKTLWELQFAGTAVVIFLIYLAFYAKIKLYKNRIVLWEFWKREVRSVNYSDIKEIEYTETKVTMALNNGERFSVTSQDIKDFKDFVVSLKHYYGSNAT